MTKSATFCENLLSLIDCLITLKREGRVMGDLDVETFPLTVSEALERRIRANTNSCNTSENQGLGAMSLK